MCYGGQTFISVGWNGTILTSNEGTRWSRQVSGTSDRLLSVTWTEEGFLVSGQGGVVLTSQDGATWNSVLAGKLNSPKTAPQAAMASTANH